MAFKIAGSMAFKDAVQRAGPILLEPYMKVEVVVPEELHRRCDRRSVGAAGDHWRDGDARRWRLARSSADAPLGEMFGYATNLRNMSQGRGSFTMEFEKYEPVPESIAEEVIKGGSR